jgi:hypothetical protein
MAIQIQIRRDTAANWTSANSVLAQGEIGVEIDTNKAKLGDGATAWTALSYWLDPTSSVALDTDNEWTGQQTFEGGFKEAWDTLSGTTPTLTHGNAIWTLSGASTPTDGLADGETLVLHVIGGDTHSVTWPGTWIGGSQPTLAGDDMIVMWKHSGTLYAKYAGAF